MFKEETVWQSESKVLKNWSHRERMFAGTGSGENSGMCDKEQEEIRIWV
jgi:hypothetical protein